MQQEYYTILSKAHRTRESNLFLHFFVHRHWTRTSNLNYSMGTNKLLIVSHTVALDRWEIRKMNGIHTHIQYKEKFSRAIISGIIVMLLYRYIYIYPYMYIYIYVYWSHWCTVIISKLNRSVFIIAVIITEMIVIMIYYNYNKYG